MTSRGSWTGCSFSAQPKVRHMRARRTRFPATDSRPHTHGQAVSLASIREHTCAGALGRRNAPSCRPGRTARVAEAAIQKQVQTCSWTSTGGLCERAHPGVGLSGDAAQRGLPHGVGGRVAQRCHQRHHRPVPHAHVQRQAAHLRQQVLHQPNAWRLARARRLRRMEARTARTHACPCTVTSKISNLTYS